MNKIDLSIDIFKIINVEIKNVNDLLDLQIDQNVLRNKNLFHEITEKIPNLKSHYNSSKLTCLHSNSLEKQKFPVVNMFRQILKCNNYKLEPFLISNGYDKTNGKKIMERYYRIRLLNDCSKKTDSNIKIVKEEKASRMKIKWKMILIQILILITKMKMKMIM